MEIQKLDRKTKERARMMYFGDYELIDIAQSLNTDLATVRFYVFGENGSGSNENCWFQIKKQLNPTSVAIYIKDKISVLDKTAGVAMNIINENLRRIQGIMLEDSSYTLSIDDTKKLAGIVVDMDKVIRLESGKATDIIDNIAHMSVADAKRILADDPFAPRVIEAEFEDLDDVVYTDDNVEDGIVVSSELKKIGKPW